MIFLKYKFETSNGNIKLGCDSYLLPIIIQFFALWDEALILISKFCFFVMHIMSNL